MEIKKLRENSKLTIKLIGKLDTITASELNAVLEESLKEINFLVFDVENLTYISSVGLRILLSAQKQMTKQGKLIIENVNKEIMDIFNITGFSSILDIKPALRQVSIENLKLIAKGYTGECYKLDDETLLKLYFEHISDELAEREKVNSKAAFLAGLPTAISFDVVACGARRGLVYEMLNATTMTEVVNQNLDKLDEYVILYSELCKQLHKMEGDAKILPDFKQLCMETVSNNDFTTEEQKRIILDKMSSIPQSKTCVHGDFHLSNILMQNGEPSIIDLGDLAIGYYMFDIGQIFNIYFHSQYHGLSEIAFGLDRNIALKIWILFEEQYFGAFSDEARNAIRKEAEFFGYLRLFMIYELLNKDEIVRNWLLSRFIPTLGI